MSHILVTIIPHRSAALLENFAAVLRELLDSLAARPWRARQASCLAMADLLPGRRWPILAANFGEMWEVSLRVADDIKDSVRVNGERLLRSIGNLTQRCACITLLFRVFLLLALKLAVLISNLFHTVR
jgi:proteasome component ECM29